MYINNIKLFTFWFSALGQMKVLIPESQDLFFFPFLIQEAQLPAPAQTHKHAHWPGRNPEQFLLHPSGSQNTSISGEGL